MQSNRPARTVRTCRFCSKSFYKAEHLDRHTRSHTKERPFLCHKCGKRYSRHDTLLRHRKSHHGEATDTTAPQIDESVSVSSTRDEVAAALVGLHSTPGYDSQAQFATDRGLSMLGETADSDFEASQISPHQQNFMSLGTTLSHDLNSISDTTQELQTAQQSQAAPSGDFVFSPLWGVQLEPFASWQIDDDFDLDAFNSSLLSDYSEQTIWQTPPAVQPNGSTAIFINESHPLSASTMDEIQRLWITKADNNFWKNDVNVAYSGPPSRPSSPTAVQSSPTAVNENYRNALHVRLRPRWKEYPLPSTEFLNSAIQAYFLKFNPIFPILHGPTFYASNQNSLLLLSMSSIGSLFMGSSAATAHGSRIFERLNKVILATWEHTMSKDTPERLYMTQAAIIGQTFAYLSGEPKYLATVEAFHGTVIAFARRCGILKVDCCMLQINEQTPTGIEQAWTSWARQEERIRTGLALYIHDAQLAKTFHHEPLLRHHAIRVSSAASNALFEAPTALKWAALRKDHPSAPTELSTCIHSVQPQHARDVPLAAELACKASRFSCYVLLQGIGAAVQESICDGALTSADQAKYEDALACWYQAYEKSRSAIADSLSLAILCHEIFMMLLVDFNQLERAIGRDGLEEAKAAMDYVRCWSSSIEARRCIIHASLIHRQTGSMRLDAEPALHVPRAVFSAALAWYCYIAIGQTEPGQSRETQIPSDAIEVRLFNVNPSQHLSEATVSSSLVGLVDYLPRIGHWGISKRLGRMLKLLVHGDKSQEAS